MKTSQVNSNKRDPEDSEKYRRVLKEAVNHTYTNKGFRTVSHVVATYEQTKKGLGNIYPKKKQIQDDGIHTKPLNL